MLPYYIRSGSHAALPHIHLANTQNQKTDYWDTLQAAGTLKMRFFGLCASHEDLVSGQDGTKATRLDVCICLRSYLLCLIHAVQCSNILHFIFATSSSSCCERFKCLERWYKKNPVARIKCWRWSIPCPWARYWAPNCSWCAGWHHAWQPAPWVHECMNYCKSLWTKVSAKCPKCKCKIYSNLCLSVSETH